MGILWFPHLDDWQLFLAPTHLQMFRGKTYYHTVFWWDLGLRLCEDAMIRKQLGKKQVTLVSEGVCVLRATSHTRLKARDHCNLRALIGQKGRDCLSSLHTRRWRPKGPKKISWMKSLHGVQHGKIWTRFHSFLESNSRRPWFFWYFF